ncbi:MAG: hypothetical protein LWX07_11100 [Bacteroidetes bacterium]|nr:hypothetical protein [Bacteroidota bacterium]
MEEIKQKFCYDNSKTRKTLWNNFIGFYEWIIKAGVFNILYFNGSFTTDKIDPNDIDCVLILPDIITQEQKDNFDFNKLFNKKFIKSLYKIDLHLSNNVMELFQTIRVEDAVARRVDHNTKKGLLMIKMNK